MSPVDDDKVRMMITLTKEEHDILKKLSDLDGKPMSSTFMNFVRDAKVFTVLKKVLKATETLVAAKSYFSSKHKKTAIE